MPGNVSSSKHHVERSRGRGASLQIIPRGKSGGREGQDKEPPTSAAGVVEVVVVLLSLLESVNPWFCGKGTWILLLVVLVMCR